MNSRVTEDFLACFAILPDAIKAQARRAYRLWCQNPSHPGLRFKRVHGREPVYSARVGLGWRVLGLLEGDTITWFWIGSHAQYEQMLKQLQFADIEAAKEAEGTTMLTVPTQLTPEVRALIARKQCT